jgi:hypothetical protein
MSIVDVAGVAIGVHASDDVRASAVLDALPGFPDTSADPAAWITVDGVARAHPTGAPLAEARGFRFWLRSGGIVATADRAMLEASGRGAVLHLPDDRDLDVVEGLVAVALAWILAPRGRYLLHGAAIARDGRGLLVLGESRAGKSTLVAAALEASWSVLSDDQVVLAADPGRLRVFGVHRDPAVPVELGGPVVERGTPMRGPRQRALLDRGELTAGGVDLAGTVVVAHSTEPAGTFATASGRRIVPLLLKSFAPTVDDALRPKFFSFTERVVALPAWELGHAADVAQRRAHVARALTRCRP